MAKKPVAKDDSRVELPEGLIALAYNRDGHLLARTQPKGDKLYFNLEPEELRYARVFVMPEPPKGLEPKSLAAAERLQAYEPTIRLGKKNEIDISRIPDQLVQRWWWYRCCTQGRVTKRFLIDGSWQDMPLCNALVHICEVDPFLRLVPLVPDHILDRFRDILLERIPIPIPDPLPDPPIFGEQPLPLPPRPFARIAAQELRSIGGQPIQQQAASLATINLPQEVRLQLNNASAEQMRKLIIDQRLVFMPYLCLWPMFWPWFYRCDEITTVRTDFNGRFEACFWRQILEEKADLYFWVEYEIHGELTTVYKPPIPCYTHWNYECGKEVNIRVTDPRVPMGCFEPLAGEIAWVKTIGWGAQVSHIEQQLGASISQQGKTFRTAGLTRYATSSLGYGLANKHVRPFASNLALVVQFGSGFPSGNVTHYLWSYRKTHNDKLIAASASEQQWAPLDTRAISKAYTIEVTSGVITTFQTQHFPLGPFPIGSVQGYKIPPVSPKGANVANNPTAEWDQNTVTMIVDTTSLRGDGLYEFKLEFFNAAGVRQNVADAVNQISNPTNTGQSQPAGSTYLLSAGEDSFRPFRMKVRVDNQKSTATIYNVEVDGRASSTECGFVKYNDKASSDVNFRIRASHPNDFATFSFNVARGNSSDPLASADTGGMVIGSTSNYTLGTDDIYRNKVKVATLLGTCPDKAAFAEHLHVDGLHTNGTSILNSFDASDLAAFALEPV